MSDDFGGGIYITRNDEIGPDWDLDIDLSGDIKTTEGSDELEKDIAYATAVALQDWWGERNDPTTRKQIRAEVQDVLEDEERIDTVLSINSRDIGNDTVEIVAVVRTSDEQYELIFEV